MKKIESKKVFYVCVVFLMSILICLVQSMVEGGAGSVVGASDGGLLFLVPESPEEGKEGGKDLISSLLPRDPEDRSIPVSADGTLSDWLLPENEHSDASDHSGTENIAGGGSYQVNGKYNILIYHTHTTEAYRQTEGYTYKAAGDSRTREKDKNVIAVGDKLKEELESYGFGVLHDTTDHEPPSLSTSYDRSLVTMKKYQQEYPEIDIYIDLHRDAANVEKSQNDVVEIDGKRCARIMFVVGKGERKNTEGVVPLPKPNWEANYALAKSICEQLDGFNDNFTRDIRVKTGRYNQHVSDMSLLVEVGHNANTLEEALNSMPYLAKAISQVVSIEA